MVAKAAATLADLLADLLADKSVATNLWEWLAATAGIYIIEACRTQNLLAGKSTDTEMCRRYVGQQIRRHFLCPRICPVHQHFFASVGRQKK